MARTEKKIRVAYASVVLSQTNMTKKLLAKMYNAFVLPHVLYLAPFTAILNESDKKQIRKLFFRYAKFLLSVPRWYCNSVLKQNYGVLDPIVHLDNLSVKLYGL